MAKQIKDVEMDRINLNVSKSIVKAFRDLVYEKHGSTYAAGLELESALKDYIIKNGKPVPADIPKSKAGAA